MNNLEFDQDDLNEHNENMLDYYLEDEDNGYSYFKKNIRCEGCSGCMHCLGMSWRDFY